MISLTLQNTVRMGVSPLRAATTGLALLSTAWQDRQGYVFLSVRDPSVEKHSPGYWKDLPFKWPDEREKVQRTLLKAERSNKDIYWSPAMFKKPRRSKDHVTDRLDLLWADLDEVDPDTLPDDLAPTAWWESSPGRFQAIWRCDRDLSPNQQSTLNQKLSYAIGADKGGWDLSQVLRIPGTRNHKYEDVIVQKPHINGAKPVKASYLSKFEAGGVTDLSEAPIPETDLPPPSLILKQRKIPARAKQLLKARPGNAVEGQRSERLWELECLLAEAGLTVPEIVSLTKSSVWNKFEGRHDEDKRLATEARKAILHVAPAETQQESSSDDSPIVADDEDSAAPLPWDEFDRDHRPIRWLVADVWAESEVGFISGTPKSYKSWLALDLAVSVATGSRFLDAFASERRKVLLIQEEDPKVVTQDRLIRIAWARGMVYAGIVDDHTIELQYDLPEDLYVMSNQGFQITDEDWLEQVKEWIIELDVDLVILDPLMMMAEGMDEFKAFEMMTKVLKPLKRLRAATNAAVCVVHHHTKGGDKKGAGAMYGSVALWAWEESAIHIELLGPGKILAERFSKHSRLTPITVEIGDIGDDGWKPNAYAGGSGGSNDLMDLISTAPEGLTLEELSETTQLSRDTLQKQLKQLVDQNKLVEGRARPIPGQKGRRRKLWLIAE